MQQEIPRRVIALAVLAFAIGGCGSDNGGTGSASDGKAVELDVAFVPKNTDNPYFEAIAVGARDAQKELGGKFEQIGTAAPDIAGQIRILTGLAQQRQPVVAVSGLDPDAVAPALERAQKLGSKVISYDADVRNDARTLYMNAAPAKDLGVVQVQNMAKAIDNKGEIAILSAQITAANQNAWIAEMKKELAKPDYQDIKLVKLAYGNDESNLSYEQAVGLLQGFPNLRGILAPTPVALSAAAKAIKDQGKQDKVEVTGLGFPPGDRQLLKDGQVDEYVLWSPRGLGYLTYYAANALAKGEITGKEGETFKAGKLGERTIGANGEIVLGPPDEFTAENVDASLQEFATK